MRRAWLLGMVLAAVTAGFVGLAGPYRRLAARATPFDELPAASVEEAAQRVARFGPDGVALYRAHLRWDAAFALANAALLAIPIGLLAGRLGWRPPWKYGLAALPVAAAGADLIENGLIGAGLGSPETLATIVSAGWATRVKFALFLASAAVVVGLGAVNVVRTISRRRGLGGAARTHRGSAVRTWGT